jgi:large subunit ribosomal protein L17
MRHRVAGRKLGRNSSQRKALWRGLITELFRYDQISTTDAKARSMRGDAEHLISVAKRGLATGGNPVHARRLAARVITDPEVTRRLFDEVAPRFVDRPGGYTRLVKVGPRLGDGADMVILELVEKASEKETKAKT